jgi:hypothetical protein
VNKKTKYEKLIFKLLTHNISDEEIVDLENWLKTEKNKKIVEEYIQLNHASNSMIHDFNALKAYNIAALKIKKVMKLKLVFLKYAAAASILLIVAFTVFLNKENNTQFTEPIIVNEIIEPGTDKATLTLGDGSQIALEKGESFQTQNANSNGEEIIYEAGKQNTTEVAYNYLTIPRGGQFFIKLSDGTQVWLNSESQLKYPVSFMDGETRMVELVYGEAYFDVSSSIEHKGSKFKVFNYAQEVVVFGTEFNIKAYRDESNIYTTLVEGNVEVGNGVLKQKLVPNQQFNLDTKTNKFTVAQVDVKGEISWKEGVFSFIDKPLKDIMKVISRWYDVDIVFENKDLESVKFLGVIDKCHSIEKILSIMKSTSINSYEINNKTIILK